MAEQICPLLDKDCLTSDCAWYCEETSKCAVKELLPIAVNLRIVSEKAEELVEQFERR